MNQYEEFLGLVESLPDRVLVRPDGVHVLSQESQDIMQRIAERSAALEARHTSKRVSL